MALPEAELINGEILLRDLQLSHDVKLTRRSTIRWLALALGLISPNETRTAMLDVLEALFFFQFGQKRDPAVDDIMAFIRGTLGKEECEKTVRYHLLQLQNGGLLERRKGRYCFSVSPLSEKGDFAATLDYVYKRRCDTTLSKIKEACRELSASLDRAAPPAGLMAAVARA